VVGNNTVPRMKGGLLSLCEADFQVHLRRTSVSKRWPQESDKSTIFSHRNEYLTRASDTARPRCRGLPPPSPPPAH
jgi:hypothetical protein